MMATERPQHSLPTHARPPRYHRCPPLCADGARHNERSPWCRPFPPDSPPTISRLCSNPSRVLWPTPTPPPRTRGSFGLGLHPPACFAGGAEVSRFSRGEFPDVHGFYRPRRAHTSLAKARRVMWPSPSVHRVGARNSVFRGSMAGPPVPLSTLHPRCRHRRRMTRGQRGSLLLHCGAPSSPTLRRFYPGAFGQSPNSVLSVTTEITRLASHFLPSPRANNRPSLKPHHKPNKSLSPVVPTT